MTLTYRFRAETLGTKRAVSGLIVADDADGAHHALKKIGLVRPDLTFHPAETLNSWLGAGVDQRELARFYRTVGVRLKNGGNPVDATAEAVDYLEDERLKTAVSIFSAQMAEGYKPHEAMKSAGFEARECMVVRAFAEGGNMAEAFTDLSIEIADRHRLTRSIQSMLRMPKIMMIAVWFAGLPGVFLGLAPTMIAFFGNNRSTIKLPESIEAFYSFVGWTQEHSLIALAIYLGVPAALWWIVRTAWFKTQLERFRDIRALSVKNDHAMLWNAYAVLYRAGIPPAEICETLAKAAARQDTRDSLLIMCRRIESGADEISAIESAQFPRFAVAYYKAAKKSGSLSDGLIRSVADLKEDVLLLTANLKDVASILSHAALGIIALPLFYIVLYPAIAPVLSNL